jgi:hypothetical protein
MRSRATRPALLALAASLLLLTGLSCGGTTPSSPSPVETTGGHRVLFIGNSLTYTNDLPGMLAAIAKTGGDTIVVASVTRPGYALIDHITAPTTTDAVARINGARWEYVVLQQGPTSRAIDRDTLILAAQRLDPAIRAAGARPALYMVWPAAADTANFDRVRLSFQQTACTTNGVFWPAGEAWRAAWRVDPSVGLYGPDRFHPSTLGTYLAAVVMYERITGKDARALPASWPPGAGSAPAPATIRALQEAAHAANAAFPTACAP